MKKNKSIQETRLKHIASSGPWIDHYIQASADGYQDACDLYFELLQEMTKELEQEQPSPVQSWEIPKLLNLYLQASCALGEYQADSMICKAMYDLIEKSKQFTYANLADKLWDAEIAQLVKKVHAAFRIKLMIIDNETAAIELLACSRKNQTRAGFNKIQLQNCFAAVTFRQIENIYGREKALDIAQKSEDLLLETAAKGEKIHISPTLFELSKEVV